MWADVREAPDTFKPWKCQKCNTQLIDWPDDVRFEVQVYNTTAYQPTTDTSTTTATTISGSSSSGADPDMAFHHHAAREGEECLL